MTAYLPRRKIKKDDWLNTNAPWIKKNTFHWRNTMALTERSYLHVESTLAVVRLAVGAGDRAVSPFGPGKEMSSSPSHPAPARRGPPRACAGFARARDSRMRRTLPSPRIAKPVNSAIIPKKPMIPLRFFFLLSPSDFYEHVLIRTYLTH